MRWLTPKAWFFGFVWSLAGCQTPPVKRDPPLARLPPPVVAPKPESPRLPGVAHPSAGSDDLHFSLHPGPSDPATDRLRQTIVSFAARYVGKSHLPCRGRRLQRDCSGFIRCVFSHAGIDLMRISPHRGDNGVLLIQRYTRRHGTLHKAKLPAIGDIVFWHYTYDRDQNQRLDDRWTHIGLVESVEPDGRIALLHYSDHVKRIYMHLGYPFSSRTLLGYQTQLPSVPACQKAARTLQRCLRRSSSARCSRHTSKKRDLCRWRRQPVFREMNSLLIRQNDPRRLHGSTTGELFAGFGTVLQGRPSRPLLSWLAPSP